MRYALVTSDYCSQFLTTVKASADSPQFCTSPVGARFPNVHHELNCACGELKAHDAHPLPHERRKGRGAVWQPPARRVRYLPVRGWDR
jgi:hypothetical protein